MANRIRIGWTQGKVMALLVAVVAAALERAWLSTDADADRDQAGFYIRELQCQDSVLGLYWQTIWPAVPGRMQGWLSYYAPVPAEQRRIQAGYRLRDLGIQARPAVPFLARALEDKSPAVRETVMSTLQQLGPAAEDAVPALLRIFRQRHSPFASEACVALSWIAPSDPNVVRACLAALGSPAALNTPEFHRRIAAVSALRRMAPYSKEVVPSLIESGREPAAFRNAVLETLGKIGAPADRVVPVLMEALDSVPCQAAAVDALQAVGPRAAAAVPKLIGIYEGARERERSRVVSAAFVGPMDTALIRRYGMAPALSWSTRSLCSSVLRSLAAIGPAGGPMAVEFLEREYADQSSPFRLDAAYARWKIDGNPAMAVRAFGEELQKDAGRAIRAFQYVAQMAPETEEVYPLIFAALEHSEMSVRMQALRTVRGLGSKAKHFLPELEEALADPKYAIRAEATNVVRQLARRNGGNQRKESR